jgi:hypothetical protein
MIFVVGLIVSRIVDIARLHANRRRNVDQHVPSLDPET